jgi:Protein of unknown function (DUF3102)
MCSRTWPPTEVVRSLKRGIENAITAGNLLIEAKAKLNKHGQWLPWLRANCTMSERTAQLYMRPARFAPELQAKSASLADLTIERATALLGPAAPVQSLERFHQFLVQVALINPRIVVTPVGMQFPDDLTFEEWLAVGKLFPLFFPDIKTTGGS